MIYPMIMNKLHIYIYIHRLISIECGFIYCKFPGFDQTIIPLSKLGCDRILGARIFIRSTSGCNAFHTNCIQHTKNQYMVFLFDYILYYVAVELCYIMGGHDILPHFVYTIRSSSHSFEGVPGKMNDLTSMDVVWHILEWIQNDTDIGPLNSKSMNSTSSVSKKHILRFSSWKGFSPSLAKFFVAISSGWSNSSRVCFIFRLVPWWFPAA